MATSPNYNWPEPDNTDLVKNGALAIRTLGNAIDTTMATMVPKSIVDAKGDLIAGTAADTTARLAVGNNGETLVADSSTATGLKWAPFPASGMTNPMTTTGDTIYSSSGSTPARLPIGSTGNVLTVAGGVPTWAAPAASGGYTLIATATPSGATGVSFTSISSSYKSLRVVFNAYHTATDRYWFFRLNNDAGSNYFMNGIDATSGSYGTNWNNTTGFGAGRTGAPINYSNNSSNGQYTYKGTFDIHNANEAATKLVSWQSSGMQSTTVSNSAIMNGTYTSNTVISQIDLVRDGTPTITGTFYLYGAK